MGIPVRGPLLTLSLSQSWRYKTFDNFCEQPQQIWILNSLADDSQQNIVVDRIKELFNIAFECVARVATISGYAPSHALHCCHSFVRSLPNPTRKRVSNKGRFKESIQRFKNCVMHNTISDCSFMNVPRFRVSNVKAMVGAMAVALVAQLLVQVKNILLQLPLKAQNIWLITFSPAKFFPGSKQALGRDDILKYIGVLFHSL